MESKLKAVRRGHKGQVTKLFKKFDEIEKNSDLDKDDVKLISDAVEQKQRTIVDLNEKILDLTSEEDVVEEIQESDDTLTEIQKFSYLKAQLHGHAAQTIEGFALTNANYTTAVNLLKDRFGSPHKIIHAYMKALMDLPSTSNDLNSLRRYGDHLETYVRGLECLGQTQEMYGALLVPIIISKLPVETRKSIAREYDSDHITLNNLRKAITKEARILEAGQFTDRDSLHTTATFLTEACNKTQRNFNTNNPRFNDKKRPCIYCTGIHFPGDCTIISDVNERLNIVKQKKKCFNCLGNHGVSECKSLNRCKKCNKKHHTSICGEQATDGKEQESKEKSTVVGLVKTEEPDTAVMYTSQHTSVLLKTAIAPIAYGKQITEASILFDEGAQRSFITQGIADKLQIRPSGRDTIDLSAFGDKEKNIRHLDTATVQLQTDKGADYYWDIVQDHVIRGNGPTAVASKIGYLLSGPVIRNGEKSLTSSVLLNVTSHHAEESDIEKFWNLESLGIRLPQQDDEESFVKTYQQDCIKFENERYSAKLPWKLDHPDLPSNIMIAKARTESTIRRLSREPHLLRKYSEIIEDQMKRGFIEKVNDENDDGKSTHYIPHHAVKKDSTTTPIRIVYDCSCKKSPDHASLNDCLMSTPPDSNDLTKILMGFRTKKYAISTDIEKAFLHIGLDEKDRDFTRFFWLSDTDNPSSTLTTYRFKSILFGATSSPFILNATLLKHLDACNTNISAMMKNDLYVDNILYS
ncbi:uncharacterized protein LOC134717595 [Mytilus trossulus]|uniref:uncharacterized protein LOC134717595 n=1 Tax=Mytilus trossulus TaxID=6551 RepID=UPI00300450BD